MTDQTYPTSDKTRLRRHAERGLYDHETVHAILDSHILCHVGYVIDGTPFVTPTTYWRDGNTLYFHGSAASRMIRNAATGIPVCVTVTHLDSLVLAWSGFNTSVNFRSAMCFGTAQKVTDMDVFEAQWAQFFERITPGRWAQLRPMTKSEFKQTGLLAMGIEEASAKIRDSEALEGLHKADQTVQGDVANTDVWMGQVPFETRTLAPIPDPMMPETVTNGITVGRLID